MRSAWRLFHAVSFVALTAVCAAVAILGVAAFRLESFGPSSDAVIARSGPAIFAARIRLDRGAAAVLAAASRSMGRAAGGSSFQQGIGGDAALVVDWQPEADSSAFLEALDEGFDLVLGVVDQLGGLGEGESDADGGGVAPEEEKGGVDEFGTDRERSGPEGDSGDGEGLPDEAPPAGGEEQAELVESYGAAATRIIETLWNDPAFRIGLSVRFQLDFPERAAWLLGALIHPAEGESLARAALAQFPPRRELARLQSLLLDAVFLDNGSVRGTGMSAFRSFTPGIPRPGVLDLTGQDLKDLLEALCPAEGVPESGLCPRIQGESRTRVAEALAEILDVLGDEFRIRLPFHWMVSGQTVLISNHAEWLEQVGPARMAEPRMPLREQAAPLASTARLQLDRLSQAWHGFQDRVSAGEHLLRDLAETPAASDWLWHANEVLDGIAALGDVIEAVVDLKESGLAFHCRLLGQTATAARTPEPEEESALVGAAERLALEWPRLLLRTFFDARTDADSLRTTLRRIVRPGVPMDASFQLPFQRIPAHLEALSAGDKSPGDPL